MAFFNSARQTYPVSISGGRARPARSARKFPAMTQHNADLAARAREALRHPERDAYAAEKVSDMLAKLENFGSFVSDKQESYFVAMIERVEGKAATPAPADRVKTDLGNFGPMVAIFNRAKEHIKTPKVALRTADGTDLVLSLAGDTARAPGTINVVTTGGYGVATWFGRILKDGAFEASPRAVTPTGVLAILSQFSADPLATIKAQGKLTGNCCLCNRKLTDKRSVAEGVGPICRTRWIGH